ncbi:mitotic checkpoint [Chlorella sorokiniana]|uniref:Mitotic checkpoint n=1 Tax=Chlorella sorokiniana TaxID=3076 RepID=A0A2P6TWI7_CHLSO|nr:mitotic checkpoint [Chlorella sorokiniana]|eukprot:PRW58435.1 mitotic checkpoint [Chlorella sorokiniana]
MAAAAALGTPLPNPPKDGITSLQFWADSPLLLVSSWDETARVYDATAATLQGTFAAGAPVLDATFENEGVIYTGGLDGSVKRYDFFSGQEAVLGAHDAGAKCVEWLPTRGLLATAGWDSTLRLWDPRAAPGAGQVARLSLPGKAYSMSASGQRLVVGCSGRHVDIYDLRTLESGQPEQRRESSLKFQTRCVRCFADGAGYALGSVEGRVAMEFFDLAEDVQARKYAFKCHRRSEGGKDSVFPVNAIAFNSRYGTFATGGGDGVVNFWDGENKKRLAQIAGYPTSVAALAFNGAATQLAVAASYTFEQGEKEHPADAIFIREVTEAEVKPKARQPAAA